MVDATCYCPSCKAETDHRLIDDGKGQLAWCLVCLHVHECRLCERAAECGKTGIWSSLSSGDLP